MYKLLLLFLSWMFVSATFAQTDVVEWKFESKKIADKKYEIRFIAKMRDAWHIYSTTQPDGGPVPTSFSFTKNPLTSFDGKVKEIGKLESRYEEVFEVDTKYFSNKVEFVQVVNVKGNAKTNVSGKLEYMACTDEQCLPPKQVPFSIALQ